MVKSYFFFCLFILFLSQSLISQNIRIIDESLLSDDFILRKNESVNEKIANNLFVRLELDKKRCYIGEPVVATFKLYTRLKSESRIVKRPSFNGFSVYDMVETASTESNVEFFKGKQYNVYILRKVQLYALQSGTFSINPMEVENEVSFIRLTNDGGRQTVDDLYNSISGFSIGQQTLIKEMVNTSSSIETIMVDPLPMQTSDDFNGAVGSFKLKAKIIEDSIYVNDLAHLKIVISGKGNFPVINPPRIDWGKDFDFFDPEVSEKYELTVCPISGAKIYIFPFIPKKGGLVQMPTLAFHYFDPAKKLFTADSLKSIQLKVLPAIRETNYEKDMPSKISSIWIYFLLAFIFLIIAVPGVYFYKKRTKAKSTLIKDLSSEQGGPMLFIEENILLDTLKKMLDNNDVKGFYKYALQAIDDYLGRKGDLEIWDADGRELNKNFTGKADIYELFTLRERIQRILYSPINEDADILKDYNTMLSLIKD